MFHVFETGGYVIMKSILQWLFESELSIPVEREEAYQYEDCLLYTSPSPRDA